MKNLLLIAITILAVGCGGKNESTTDTKPVEEKVVEVKEEAKTEEPLAETKPNEVYLAEFVNYDELEEREGIMYLKGLDTPHAGKAFTLWENGQNKSEGNYKDGKKEGLEVWWYENGKKKKEINYKNGKRDGLCVEWRENGQRWDEKNYKDGKFDGLWMAWHSNGQQMMEVNYKDGEIDGLDVWWHKNGQKKKEVNYKDGEEVEGSAKYWNSKGEPVDSWDEAVAE